MTFSRYLLLILGGVAFAVPGFSALPAGVPFSIISPAAASALREKAAQPAATQVIARARVALTRPPAPLARLHTEGTLPHHGIADASREAEKDFKVLLDLALAYRLTGEDRFLKQADTYLLAWFPLYHPSLNPIDETGLSDVILAYDLTRGALPEATQTTVNGFLSELARGYLGALRNGPKKYGDNWQSHRVKLATLAAAGVGDPALLAQAHEAFSMQIASNIRPDGSVLDFEKRDALHYVTYDLEPLCLACLAAHAHGEDWFHETSAHGASVAQAVDWFLPYARGEKLHEEFVHSKVKFDVQRAQAGLSEYAGLWDRKHAITLLALAAALDPSRRAELARFTASTGQTVPEWVSCLFGP